MLARAPSPPQLANLVATTPRKHNRVKAFATRGGFQFYFLSTGVPDAITPPTAEPAARNKDGNRKQVLVFEGVGLQRCVTETSRILGRNVSPPSA